MIRKSFNSKYDFNMLANYFLRIFTLGLFILFSIVCLFVLVIFCGTQLFFFPFLIITNLFVILRYAYEHENNLYCNLSSIKKFQSKSLHF